MPTCPLDGCWETRRGRLWVQVDCESLADLLSGRAFLASDEDRLLMVRIARKLEAVTRRWQPIRDVSDFIIWSPREYNAVADPAVNSAMDNSESWSIVNDALLTSAFESNTNLRLCVDGGRRTSTLAKLGMALYAVICDDNRNYSYEALARQGMMLESVNHWPCPGPSASCLKGRLARALKQRKQHRQGLKYRW